MFHLFFKAVSMTHCPSLADPASVLLPSKTLFCMFVPHHLAPTVCHTEAVESGGKRGQNLKP